MNELIAPFIQEVTALSPTLAAAHQETVEYWAPDSPPATIALARSETGSLDHPTTLAVYAAIETALRKGNPELTMVVATGLIEAIASRAWRIGVWEEVLPLFGELSARHAKGWVGA